MSKTIDVIIFYLIFIMLVLLCTFKQIGIDNDSINYYNSIQRVLLYGEESRSDYMFQGVVDFLSYINTNVINLNVYTSFFFVFSFMSLALKFLYIIKRLPFAKTSLLVYLCLFFIVQDFTQIRLAVAVGFLYFAIDELTQGRKIKFLLLVLIAALFHSSALCLLILLSLDTKSYSGKLFLAIPFIALLLSSYSIFILDSVSYISNFLFPSASGKLKMYIGRLESDGFTTVNKLNLLIIINYFLLFLCTIRINKLLMLEPRVIIWLKTLSISLGLYFLFSSMPVFAFRFSELFSIVLICIIPLLIYSFSREGVRIICLAILSFYLILYTYNLVVLQELINFDA